MDQPEFMELIFLWEECENLQLPVSHLLLGSVATAAVANIKRVVSLGVLPVQVFNGGMIAMQIMRGEVDQRTKQRIEDSLVGAPMFMEQICENSCAEGFAMLMSSQVVGAWTAFESLTGDLWEAALNVCPKVLAKLSGVSRRIEKLAQGKPLPQLQGGSREVDDKKVSLGDIEKFTRGTYDLRQNMGSMLRARFNFSVLEEIRQAYSCAFAKRHDVIDAALADKAIDALNIVRNIIVHNNGIADDEYVQRLKSIPPAPPLKLGESLQLDGKIVKELIGPVIRRMAELITEVDLWVTTTEKQDAERKDGSKTSIA